MDLICVALVNAVHKKALEDLKPCRGFYALAAPGHLGEEVSRDMLSNGVWWSDEERVAEIQEKHFERAMAFWIAMGYEDEEGSNYRLFFVKAE